MASQGMKAYWIATQIGVSPQTFRNIRKGDRELRLSEAQRLAEVFGVPVETFLAAPAPDTS